MLRIQMYDLPPKAKVNGKVGNLGLADDEGIGNEVAFAYDKLLKVIAVQRSKSLSAKTIAEYFSRKGGAGQIVFLPVIQSDALKRLARMKETRRLKIRFAGVANPAFFKGKDDGVDEMIDVLRHFSAPSATFEMSMGHQRGSLLKARIISTARHLAHLFNEDTGEQGEVNTMAVSGVLDDDTRDEFDVLAFRMVEVVSVETNAHRRSTYKKRRPGVKHAWEQRKEELASMFGE